MSTAHSSVENEPAARIVLIDNTQPQSLGQPSTTRSTSPASDHRLSNVSSFLSRRSDGTGKREILRKAIAERRYKRWSMEPYSGEATEEDDDEEIEPSPDSKVVPRAPTEESIVSGTDGVDDENGGPAGNTQRGCSIDVQNSGPGYANGGQKRRTGRRHGKETEIAEIDVLYENQRGWFVCGIPLFSSKSLLNFDPSAWQNHLFHDSAVSIFNAQVPDPTWVWDWKSWYVDMTTDVDEEGWAYSFSFSPAFAWHGNHVWFHSFVRRRRWLRKRIKIPQGDNSREGSVERSGHGLNNDYFTIHSRKERSSWHAYGGRSAHNRRSVLEGGSDWGGTVDEESEEDLENIKDIPTLMRVVKRARVDREKIEAIMRFIIESGDEIAYLPEKMHLLMGWMVFQASRRYLLANLTSYADKYEAGESPDITQFALSEDMLPLDPDPVSPRPSASSKSLLSKIPSSENLPSPSLPPGASQIQVTRDRAPKLDGIRKCIETVDENVRRLEYWSDKKDAALRGESAMAEQGWTGDGLGISGPNVTMKARDKRKGKERVL